MPLRRHAGVFWGARKRSVEAAGFRFEAMDATASEEEVVVHSHDQAHFIFVTDGCYISGAKAAPVLSATPLLIYNPPGTTHRDRFLHGRGSFLAVTVGEAAASLAPDSVAGGEARIVNDLSSVHFAQSLADLILGGSEQHSLAENLGLSLLAAIAPDEPRPAPAAPPWLTLAFEMIMEDSRCRRVSEVSAYVGVHPVHLARVFRRYVGRAPGELIRARQIERTAAMLTRRECGLAEVSAEAGYADQSHLTNRFRHSFGMSPGAWRGANVAFLQDE